MNRLDLSAVATIGSFAIVYTLRGNLEPPWPGVMAYATGTLYNLASQTVSSDSWSQIA